MQQGNLTFDTELQPVASEYQIYVRVYEHTLVYWNEEGSWFVVVVICNIKH